MTAQKIATRIMEGIRKNPSANRNVYRVDPPIGVFEWDDDYEKMIEVGAHSLVVVSQANVPMSGWETYIFPCGEDGEVTDWGELAGSRRGFYHPDDLLRELGYEVVENEN